MLSCHEALWFDAGKLLSEENLLWQAQAMPIAGSDFTESNEDLSGGQTQTAASHGSGDAATQRRFVCFSNWLKLYK